MSNTVKLNFISSNNTTLLPNLIHDKGISIVLESMLMNPVTNIHHSTQTTVIIIVKQTAEYPNRGRKVIRKPKPTNNITCISIIPEFKKNGKKEYANQNNIKY